MTKNLKSLQTCYTIIAAEDKLNAVMLIWPWPNKFNGSLDIDNVGSQAVFRSVSKCLSRIQSSNLLYQSI